MKILVTKVGGALKPVYSKDYDAFNSMPDDEMFEVEYKKQRNPAHHRKFFALLNLAFQNQGLFQDQETMRKCLLIECGYSDEIINNLTGEVFINAKSLNFGSMCQNDFNQVYTDVRNYICSWLGIDNEELENNINQYF